MSFFDATTIAIVLPSTILWVTIFAVQRKKNRDFSLLSNEASLSLVRANNHAKMAQIKIYGLCLAIGGILLCALNSLNPQQASTIFTEGLFCTLLTLLCNVLCSIAMVLPVFYLLQSELTRRLIFKSNLQISRVEHLFLFCTIALYLLPLFEALKFSLGFSTIPFWVIKNIFRVSIAVSTIPLSAWGMVIAFKPMFWGQEFKGVKGEQLLSYIEFLKDRNFDLPLIAYKTDAEVDCIISIAKQMGDLDKAELLSEHLVKRHLLSQEHTEADYKSTQPGCKDK